jgi:hypothetical protein
MAPWPNLFVVGASKAGTTSLWRYLDAHPDIFMSRMKEPHYFAGFMPHTRIAALETDDYLALFRGAEHVRWRGDASPSNLVHARAAPAIKERCPDARIVISLRDPVERAYSAYLQRRLRGTVDETFTDVAREGSKNVSGDHGRFIASYLAAEHVERYQRLFGPALHILLFEDLVADRAAVMGGVFEFLDVDAGLAPADPTPHNAFRSARGPVADRLLASQGLRRRARQIVPAPLRPQVERILSQPAPKPALPDDARVMLTTYYRDDVERLGELLGRPLPWGS